MSKKLWHRIKLHRIRQRRYEMQDVWQFWPKIDMSDRSYVVSPRGPWVRVL